MIQIDSHCVFSEAQLRANIAANSHVPCAQRVNLADPSKRQTKPLAVVGGGPLVVHDLPELRSWPGDVWGINYTAQWLNEQGVKASLFSIDPQPFIAEAPHAVLVTASDPKLVAHYANRLTLVDYEESGGGETSATRALAVGLFLGYLKISLFGCEGSFGERTHVDRHDPCHEILVRAGETYRTTPEFLIQCMRLVEIVRMFDGVFHNRSGGLLQAMLAHPWEVVT